MAHVERGGKYLNEPRHGVASRVLVGFVLSGLDCPRRSLVCAGGLRAFCVFARGLHGTRRMVGRGVDGVQAQRRRPGVDDVVPGTRRDLHRPSVGYVLLEVQAISLGPHHRPPAPRVHPEELIGARV